METLRGSAGGKSRANHLSAKRRKEIGRLGAKIANENREKRNIAYRIKKYNCAGCGVCVIEAVKRGKVKQMVEYHHMDDLFFPEGSIWEQRKPLTKPRKPRVYAEKPKPEEKVPQCLCVAGAFNPECPIATDQERVAYMIELDKEEARKKLLVIAHPYV